MEHYGILSLLPVAVVIVLVFFTRRTAASLLAGTVVGAVLLYGTGFPRPWLDVVYGVMGSDLWIWLVLVCGFFGSLVALFEKSGGILGFTAVAARFCKGERRTLLGAWLLGVVIFVDDWLSILSVGAAMRQATKNILYMIAGSDAPQLYKAHMTTVGKILLIVFLVLMLLFIQYYVRYFLRLRKWKKGQMLT